MDEVLSRIIRYGVVSAVDQSNRKVRVIFENMDMTSGWVYVLQHNGTCVNVGLNGLHVHEIKDAQNGESLEDAGEHKHSASLTYWMPKVRDKVIVLYMPVYNGDGFVLGAI